MHAFTGLCVVRLPGGQRSSSKCNAYLLTADSKCTLANHLKRCLPTATSSSLLPVNAKTACKSGKCSTLQAISNTLARPPQPRLARHGACAALSHTIKKHPTNCHCHVAQRMRSAAPAAPFPSLLTHSTYLLIVCRSRGVQHMGTSAALP